MHRLSKEQVHQAYIKAVLLLKTLLVSFIFFCNIQIMLPTHSLILKTAFQCLTCTKDNKYTRISHDNAPTEVIVGFIYVLAHT